MHWTSLKHVVCVFVGYKVLICNRFVWFSLILLFLFSGMFYLEEASVD